MALAEEGGNQPQRVLLVGGPQHGKYINLPEGQPAYEFTSDKSLMSASGAAWSGAWGSWPQTASHLYSRDDVLSDLTGQTIFTHEVLWNSPAHGGFNLHALRDATEHLEKAKAKLDAAQEALQAKQQIVSDRNREIGELEARYTTLLKRTMGVRQIMEAVAINVTQAMGGLGDYVPISTAWGPGDE